MSKEETRKKILQAAEKLFQKYGYDGVPTKLIAKEAGITEMTLFNHFKKKELLYRTVVKERYFAIEIESALETLTYDDLEKDLTTISTILIDSLIRNKSILMMRLKEKQNFLNDPSFKVEQDPILEQITSIFEKYSEKGLIKQDSKSAALLFITTFKGMCYLCFLEGKDRKTFEALAKGYVNTFCHGIIEKNKADFHNTITND